METEFRKKKARKIKRKRLFFELESRGDMVDICTIYPIVVA